MFQEKAEEMVSLLLADHLAQQLSVVATMVDMENGTHWVRAYDLDQLCACTIAAWKTLRMTSQTGHDVTAGIGAIPGLLKPCHDSQALGCTF